MILHPEDPRQMFFVSRAELVSEEPLVRTIDEVVNSFDLEALYDRYSEGGRSFYDPAMLLKVLFFTYSDGVRSSREIAKRIKYDIRYQYFAGNLRPDFRTINRFRAENLDLLGEYFARIVTQCEELGLVDMSVLAIDGTKIRASSSSRRTVSKKKLDKLANQFRAELARDVAAEGEDLCDEESLLIADGTEETAPLSPDGGKSSDKVTDPDARFMKTSEGALRPSYNSHIAVDTNQVIVAVEVSTCADDSVSFQRLVEQSQHHVRGSPEVVLTDGGYYSGSNVKHSVTAGYDWYVPVPQHSRVPDQQFEREAFVYNESTDRYQCPAGKTLPYRTSRTRRGVTTRVYRGSVLTCGQCRLRPRCTKKRYRELNISEFYHLERKMHAKMSTESGRAIYGRRKCLVEPVFGNLKFNLGFTRFKLRSLAKVRGEFLLMCIAHNLKKLATYGSLLDPVQTAVCKAVSATPLWLLRLSKRLQKALRVDFGHFHAHYQPTA